jgi:hypothetical protein
MEWRWRFAKEAVVAESLSRAPARHCSRVDMPHGLETSILHFNEHQGRVRSRQHAMGLDSKMQLASASNIPASRVCCPDCADHALRYSALRALKQARPPPFSLSPVHPTSLSFPTPHLCRCVGGSTIFGGESANQAAANPVIESRRMEALQERFAAMLREEE